MLVIVREARDLLYRWVRSMYKECTELQLCLLTFGLRIAALLPPKRLGGSISKVYMIINDRFKVLNLPLDIGSIGQEKLCYDPRI